MRPNPGELVGNKYRIVRLIGDGGMGAVYEARHEVLGSVVALKFLHGELARRPGLASRFLQEAKVSASIQSPHVTRVTDVDTALDGSPYLVMELLTGESLQQMLDRRSKIGKDQAIDFALQILSGLEAAHALGVVHRDLKPDNVFITPSAGGPVLKLLDFGIAKLRESSEFKKGLTRPGAIMGTPEYMAPEQLYAAERVDHRADLYSLGAILYEMLTGERPAYGDDAQQIVAQVAAGKVKRITEHDPSLPEGLADVVHKALAPDKTQRFGGAMELRVALAAFAGQLSHAGRLAATPLPAASIADPERAEAKPAETVDVPPHVERKSGVPATLPPDDRAEHSRAPAATIEAASARAAIASPTRVEARVPPTAGVGNDASMKGATQEAPKQLLNQLAQPEAAVQASAYPVPPAAYAAYPHAPPPARSRTPWGAIIALFLGVLVTAGVIIAIVVTRPDDEDEPRVQPLAPPTTTLTAQPGTPELPAGSDPAPQESSKPTRPLGTGKARADGGTKDGGTGKDGGSGGGGQTSPFPQFPLPSGFPALPSGFPQLPFPFPQPASSRGK